MNNLSPTSKKGYEILDSLDLHPAEETQDLHIRHCAYCSAPFALLIKGRKRRYCSDACKMMAYRARKFQQVPSAPGHGGSHE